MINLDIVILLFFLSNSLCKCFIVISYSDIKPGVEFSAILELTPLRPGLKQIYAILECDQLHDIKGVEEVFVIAN